MPATAVGPKKSRSSVTKVVPAIPHALTSRPKAAKPDGSALSTAVKHEKQATVEFRPPETAGKVASPQAETRPSLDSQHAATSGDLTPSISTSERSIATLTSQSTPPASASQHETQQHSRQGFKDGLNADVVENARASGPNFSPPHELPAPFYPANQHSDSSFTTPTAAQTRIPPTIQASHSRNNSSLTFGGLGDVDVSSSMASAMPSGPLAGPPVPFPSHNTPHAFIPNGHSYHLSDPSVGPIPPAPYMHGNGHSAYPREYYPTPPSQARPFPTNARAPPPRRDQGPGHGLPPQRPIPVALVNGHPGPQVADAPPGEALALARHVRSQFGNREFADHYVVISHHAHKLSPGTFALHGIILTRSPKLRSLMSMNQQPNPAAMPRSLHLVISDRFVDLDDIVAKGLMHLYGEPLLTLSTLSEMPTAPGFAPDSYLHLRAALAYAAFGHFLQMDAIVIRGLDLAAGLLNWQNIGLALAFGLEGGLASSWNESAGDKSSASPPEGSTSPASAPTYGIYSDRMLHAVMHFIIENFPVDFDLVSSVPQLPEAPRLPIAAEPRHARSGSRLSQIRFGEMTVEERGPEATVLSGVLLSLPFPVLKHVLEHPSLVARLGADGVADVMRKTIEEREQRRQRIATADGSAPRMPESSHDERLWNSVRWVEGVEAVPTQMQERQGESCGLRLVRHNLSANGRKSGAGHGQA